MTYSVDAKTFTSFFAAVAVAKASNSVVIEVSTGLVRWSDTAKVSKTSKVRHVFINADGSHTEFSKVKAHG